MCVCVWGLHCLCGGGGGGGGGVSLKSYSLHFFLYLPIALGLSMCNRVKVLQTYFVACFFLPLYGLTSLDCVEV